MLSGNVCANGFLQRQNFSAASQGWGRNRAEGRRRVENRAGHMGRFAGSFLPGRKIQLLFPLSPHALPFSAPTAFRRVCSWDAWAYPSRAQSPHTSITHIRLSLRSQRTTRRETNTPHTGHGRAGRDTHTRTALPPSTAGRSTVYAFVRRPRYPKRVSCYSPYP